MSGWICSHRVIWEHPLFRGHADRVGMWHWILHHAAWETARHDVNGKIVTIGRGQVCASLKRIADECGVGIQVVRTFLGKLRDEHAIDTDANTGRLIITICNYDKYQDRAERANTSANTRATREQHAKEQENTSVPYGTGAEPDAPSVRKQAFDIGKRLLAAHGVKKPGGVINKWLAQASEADVLAAILSADGRNDPVAFIGGCLRRRAKEDRRDLSIEEDLERRGFRDLENDQRNFSRGGHRRPPAARDAADHLPGVLAFPAQEDRPVPVGDVRAGSDTGVLPSLRMVMVGVSR